MDFVKIVEELGGGLPAVVIAALGWAYWLERRRANELADRHTETLLKVTIETTAAINTLATAIRDQRGAAK